MRFALNRSWTHLLSLFPNHFVKVYLLDAGVRLEFFNSLSESSMFMIKHRTLVALKKVWVMWKNMLEKDRVSLDAACKTISNAPKSVALVENRRSYCDFLGSLWIESPIHQPVLPYGLRRLHSQFFWHLLLHPVLRDEDSWSLLHPSVIFKRGLWMNNTMVA